MKPIKVQIITSSNAKLTVAAEEIRIKLPEAWTKDEAILTLDFLTRIAQAAPDVGMTLRGERSLQASGNRMKLHTGDKRRSSYKGYWVTLEEENAV